MASFKIAAMDVQRPVWLNVLGPSISLVSLVLVNLAVPLAQHAQAQMLMNLAPQAIPNSSTGPGYSNTLSTFKQAVDQQSPNLSVNSPAGSAPDSVSKPVMSPARSNASPTPCVLKVQDMNRIQRHEVVRVVSDDCRMVFNATE